MPLLEACYAPHMEYQGLTTLSWICCRSARWLWRATTPSEWPDESTSLFEGHAYQSDLKAKLFTILACFAEQVLDIGDM